VTYHYNCLEARLLIELSRFTPLDRDGEPFTPAYILGNPIDFTQTAPTLPVALINCLSDDKTLPKVKIDLRWGIVMNDGYLSPIFDRIISIRPLTRPSPEGTTHIQELLCGAHLLEDVGLDEVDGSFTGPPQSFCAMKKLQLTRYAWDSIEVQDSARDTPTACGVWNFSRLEGLNIVNDMDCLAGFLYFFSKENRVPALKDLKIALIDYSGRPRAPTLQLLFDFVGSLRNVERLNLNAFNEAALLAVLPQFSNTLQKLHLPCPRDTRLNALNFLTFDGLQSIIRSCPALEVLEIYVPLEDVSFSMPLLWIHIY
jgi:hypothetical protein